MKKKPYTYILTVFLLFAAVGCSKADDSKEASEIPDNSSVSVETASSEAAASPDEEQSVLSQETPTVSEETPEPEPLIIENDGALEIEVSDEDETFGE